MANTVANTPTTDAAAAAAVAAARAAAPATATDGYCTTASFKHCQSL